MRQLQFKFDSLPTESMEICLFHGGGSKLLTPNHLVNCALNMAYYFIHLGCFMCFTMHFYIIFGTNLLTPSPVPVPVFFLVSVFQRKGISNGVETEWNLLEKLFLEGKLLDRLGVHVRKETREPRGRGRALHPRGPLVAPLTYFFRLYISIYPKTFGEQNRSGVPPSQASVATKNQSGPCSGTLPEEGSITGGHLHHLSLSMTRRE